MQRVALIPARGGSKRLPRKNIMAFRDKPMLAYSVEAALETGLFDRVVVSTEDQEIAEVAQEAGAIVDKRDPELATDTAMVRQVCLDFLDREENAGRAYDQLCVLYATAPMRGAEDISSVVNLLVPGSCDFALAVTEYDMPPHQALKLLPDNWLEPMWPDIVAERADSIGPLRVDNGSTYAVNVAAFREYKSFYGPKLRGHPMPHWQSVDIDTPENFDLALYFAERYTK